MRSIAAPLVTMLEAGTQTFAMCWKISRTDGTFKYFADHDADILVSGNTYLASASFKRTALSLSEGLAVDNIDIEGFLDSPSITEVDLLAGRYDYAAVEIFLVDYTNPTAGTISLITGNMGDVGINRNSFSAHFNGLTQLLEQAFGEVTSADCRAVLGDARCKKVLTTFTKTGSVVGVTSNRQFTATLSAVPAAGYYDNGVLTWTSGQNNGLKMEIKTLTGATPYAIQLQLPMLSPVAATDTFSIVAGCDHSFAMCQAKFANAVNFVGEPHLPGTDKMLQSAA